MISIIIPVYNDINYLYNCLNSILKQSYQNYEIICIDDNSKDSSIEILEYFAKKDPRVKIFKNEINKGKGYCWNRGLELAKGEYIFFLDAKNWLSFDALKRLVDKTRKDNLDVLLFKNMIFDEKNHKFYMENYFDMNYLKKFNSEVFNHMDLDKENIFYIPKGPWNKFYSKSFLDEHDIRFPNEKLNHESDSFFYTMITAANRISFLDKYLVTCSVESENDDIFNYKHLIEDISFIYRVLDIFLENKKLYSYYKKELLKYIFSSLLEEYNALEENYHEKFFNEARWFYKDLVKHYELYDEILENVDDDILMKLKFKKLLNEVIDSNPRITVIIPVYNVSDYLEECLDSIINQTFLDTEIICVNDGSTDNSLEILREYAKRDRRIEIYSQENHGLGYTRNIALNYATGDYVFFIDSDDYILLDSLELLYKNAESNQSDLVIYKISRLNEEELIYSHPGFPLEEIFGDIDYNNHTFNYKDIKKHVLNSSFQAFAKLYRKKFLDSVDDLKFSEGIAYEDVIFHVKSLLNASRMSFLPEFCYIYRISNPNAIMKSNAHVWDIFKVSDEVEDYLNSSDYIKEFEIEFRIFKIRQFSQYIPLADSEEYTNHVIEKFKDIDLEGIPNYFKNMYNEVLDNSKI